MDLHVTNAIVNKISTTEAHLKEPNCLTTCLRDKRVQSHKVLSLSSLDRIMWRVLVIGTDVNKAVVRTEFVVLNTFTFYTVRKCLGVGNVMFGFAHQRR